MFSIHVFIFPVFAAFALLSGLFLSLTDGRDRNKYQKIVTLAPGANVTAPYDSSEVTEKIKVAVVSAGELRSFAYVERSWIRYLFHQSESTTHMFLFVHAGK